MKKIFYFIHVPWNWIKQRPQFIAEELAENYDVDIYQEKPYVSNLVVNTDSVFKVTSLFRLPMNRMRIGRKINAWLIRHQLKSKINRYNYLWITSPTLYKSVKDIIPENQKVIYDCMDDILAFPAIMNDAGWTKEMEEMETDLLERADVVLCTSTHLKEKLQKRYNLNKKIHIANNAITIYDRKETELPSELNNLFSGNHKNLTYIGTISGWFDFDLIIKTLNNHSALKIYLFGPTEVEIPRHERLIHFGPVPHEQVYGIMAKAGVLIMPFILNELILSVNPVKLYEYIYCGKNTIARKYGETEKFNEYVYLYENDDEFDAFVASYCNDELKLKLPVSAYKEFGLNNTWRKRVQEIEKLL